MPGTILHERETCALCGHTVGPDPQSVAEGQLCAPCAEDCPCCERCGRLTDDLRETVDGDDICPRCANDYYDCDGCERLATRVRATAWGTDLCGCCASHLWGCDGCSDLIDCGDYCESCEEHYRDDGESDYRINDYGYKPLPWFHGDGPLFLGAELEINVPHGYLSECADIATAHLGRLGYLKDDSSIDHGFEIVTHPMSYRWAMQWFPWDMLADLADEGCDGEGTGLHVHVSRAAFSCPAHVYRWMKLLHRNHDQVVTLARRESNWATFTETDRRNVKHYAKGAKGARYRAINTQNTDTFELRIFASTLDRQQVQAALGLAAASVEYTRALTVADIATRGGWDWSAFTAWVGEHREYAALARELRELSCAC